MTLMSIEIVLETPQVLEEKRRNRVWSWITKSILPILILVGWTALAKSSWVPSLTMPSPWGTVLELKSMFGNQHLASNIGVSLTRAVVGLLFGGAFGFVVGLFSGLTKIGEELFDATLQALRAIPFIALIPLFILWFGIGETPKILVVALASYFPMYINTAGGVRNVDRKVVEAAKTFGVERLALLRQVILPLALPQILTGLSLSMVVSILALVAGETISSQNGIGYLLLNSQAYQRNYEVFACVVLYAIMGLGAAAIVKLLERLCLKWREGVAVR
jgi:sulfonate transport system permease protein